jgi:1-acyl-sn-glycerol-3-phosphate acyltransferase
LGSNGNHYCKIGGTTFVRFIFAKQQKEIRVLNPFKQDSFGYNLLIKRVVIFVFGIITWYRFFRINSVQIIGGDKLKGLPKRGVLFVSNHQTYFADVSALYQVFNATESKVYNRVPFYTLFRPKLNVFFVAAAETMKKGILPKLMRYAGSVSIKRTWREAGKQINRGVDPKDIANIKKAMETGWTITFPQGTTRPFVKGRRGTVHLIRELNPVVVPVVINGFRRAFDKTGMLVKSTGNLLTITFKEPLELDFTQENDDLLDQIMVAIEQAPEFLKIKEE